MCITYRKYHDKNVHLPVHCTPAFLAWLAHLWFSTGKDPEQFSTCSSLPLQLKLSRNIGPAPLRYCDNTMGSKVHSLIYYARCALSVEYLLSREYPSCWQTTPASSLPNPDPHIVPQVLLKQISTLPSVGVVPSTSLTSPSEQFAGRVPFSEIHSDKYHHKSVRIIHLIAVATKPWLHWTLHNSMDSIGQSP